jgi:hypothetical protein
MPMHTHTGVVTGLSPAIVNSLTGKGVSFAIRNPYLGLTRIIASTGYSRRAGRPNAPRRLAGGAV